jgi:hypothetical protein
LQETQEQRFPVVPLSHQTSATVSAPVSRQTAEVESPPFAPPRPLEYGFALPIGEENGNSFRIESRSLPAN